MGYVKCWTMMLAVLFSASCSAPEPPPKKTVFDTQLQQMDKAREVQKTVDDAAEKTKTAVDEQERGDPGK